MLDKSRRWLESEGIRVCWTTHDWNASDLVSTTKAVDTWFKQTADFEEHVVLIAAFSGAGASHFKDFEDSFKQIAARLHDRQSTILLVEPRWDKTSSFFEKLEAMFSKVFSKLFGGSPRLPMRPGRFPQHCSWGLQTGKSIPSISLAVTMCCLRQDLAARLVSPSGRTGPCSCLLQVTKPFIASLFLNQRASRSSSGGCQGCVGHDGGEYELLAARAECYRRNLGGNQCHLRWWMAVVVSFVPVAEDLKCSRITHDGLC